MTANVTLEKTYNPQQVEPDVYAAWEESGAFAGTPDDRPHDQTFTIVIPPPNVTGALHLGHALNNTLQDILVRYFRMRGFNTLWQPGTDHAGIATQAVVEGRIRRLEGLSRHDLGREKLVERIWEWKDEYEKRIISQLKLMGCSCDWSRTRFTLDDGLARAVRLQFFEMFKDGLIFRGKRLVNWDTQLQTAVADDEVYYETVKGHFWYFKYPIIDPHPGEPDHVLIATTRPESMLGDTAVAVCPDPAGVLNDMEQRLGEELRTAADKDRPEIQRKLDAISARRETHLELLVRLSQMARDGRRVLLPLVEREIPLVTDEWADPLLGTGCVKITPAHDPNDYEVGLRQGLPAVNVLTADGKIAPIIEPDGTRNTNSDAYEGLDFTMAGREKVVADLEERGLLHEVEERKHEVGHSDRSKHPIEPYLSDQWFVRTGEHDGPLGCIRESSGLAQAAIDEVAQDRLQVFPQRYAKSYVDWLDEKRDWCISRQLWWGHRIPVWHRRFELTAESGTAELAEAGVKDMLEPGGPSDATCVATICRADSGERVHLPLQIEAPAEFDVYVCSRDDESMTSLESSGFVRDGDVLDTWFSSALWPFSTLGWPESTEHLRQYYPGSVLCTSRDIITNWVARMVMFGLFAQGEKPFDHVYIHPKILDGRGETMSKSKGNGVDPVDIIHTHGADALRYTMADMCTETQDIRMPVEYICPECGALTDQSMAIKAETQRRKSIGEKLDRKVWPSDCHEVNCANSACGKSFATQWAPPDVKERLPVARETSDKFDIGRNFCNKLWNAARFAFLNLESTPSPSLHVEELPPEDRWILAALHRTIRRYHDLIGRYQFSAAVKELRSYFWESLCDWYIELTKPRMALPADDPQGASARQVLALCIDQVLRLFHPTIPFITERLWAQLEALVPRRGIPGTADLQTGKPLIESTFPPVEGYPGLDDGEILGVFENIQTATRGVRDLRTQCDVAPRQKVEATVVLPDDEIPAFRNHAHILSHMAGVGEVTVVAAGKRPPDAGSVTIGGMKIYVHDISDDAAELSRTSKALADVEKQIKGKAGKLANEKFVANAKPEIVEAERERLGTLQAQQKSLIEHLHELED